MTDPDLSKYDAEHLNQLAGLLQQQRGWLPLNVRYGAAAAALDVVGEWQAAEPEEG